MSKNTKIVLVLLLLCVVIAVVPLVMLGGTAEFGGADGEAESAITEIDKDYEPWYASPMEHIFPDGLPGEIESLLFCLQAALGAGVFFVCLGRLTMRSKMRKQMAAAGVDVEAVENAKVGKKQ
ncbi:MAG: energy-coupling factor ABC transporter substrate-binding protein [Bacillota bacterium]|nr:energy-coupling factor ABC transporter substrate-binding protein [Bacillota bacterium]